MKLLTVGSLTLASILFAQNLTGQCITPLAEQNPSNLEISATYVGQSFIPDCLVTIDQISVTSNSSVDINNVTLRIIKQELSGNTEIFTQNNVIVKGKVNGSAVPTIIDLVTNKPTIIPALIGGPIKYFFILDANTDLQLQAHEGLLNFLLTTCTAVVTPALVLPTVPIPLVDANVDLAFSISTSSAVLPIQSISFTGTNEKDKNVLQWVTATELNNDYFEVEYRTNSGEFISLGTVKSPEKNSNTEKLYQFVHNQPSKSVNYYRLKQISLNGKADYSKTITINNLQKQGLAVYPNPVKDRLILQADNGTIDNVKIYHINGQLIYAQQKAGYTSDIDVSNFLNGVYFVSATLNNETYMTKFVKN